MWYILLSAIIGIWTFKYTWIDCERPISESLFVLTGMAFFWPIVVPIMLAGEVGWRLDKWRDNR